MMGREIYFPIRRCAVFFLIQRNQCPEFEQYSP
jgi:hypothetical protein